MNWLNLKYLSLVVVCFEQYFQLASFLVRVCLDVHHISIGADNVAEFGQNLFHAEFLVAVLCSGFDLIWKDFFS